MSHLPYEDWIFSDEPLSIKDTLTLKAHLQGCGECRRLADAWQSLDIQLRAAPIVEPSSGFVGRFQVRFERERQSLHRRQIIATLIFSLVAAALALGSLILLALPALRTPDLLLWAWFSRLVSLWSFTSTVQGVLTDLLRVTNGVIPFFWWIIFAGLLSELGVLWILSLRLLTDPRRVTK